MKKDRYKKVLCTFFLFLALLLLDVFFKFYAYKNIPLMSGPFPYGGMKVFENFCHVNFSINYVENRGAMWGIFSSFPQSLFFLRIALILFLMGYLFFQKEKQKSLPLLFILTGAIGNVIDKVVYGYVIDLFHFTFYGRSYGVFNLADAMITFGVFWLFFLSLKHKKRVDA